MFKIVRKADMPVGKERMMRIASVLLALVASALVMALMGYNPLEVYRKILQGSVMSLHRLRSTMNKAIPLTILSLGVAIAFKMKFWNIGAEGQMCMGAFGAAWVALNFGSLPSWLLLLAMMIAAIACAALYSAIPALLKLKFATSETLVTLMLNYIAIKWLSYLQYGPWRDPNGQGFPKIASFPPNAVLPSVLNIQCGWIIALVLAVIVHILLTRSKLGYEISVLGESETTARYAGMNVAKTTLIAIAISGGICGLAGMVQASAVSKTLNDQISGGLGFTAVITTWLAQLSAPAIVGVSFLFAMLMQGGVFLQTSMKIPASVSDVLQGVIIFFVLGCEFFLHYSIVYVGKKKIKEEKGNE